MGKSVIFIPARLDSKRLPGKPLIEVGGKALVQWTYERAKQTKADYVFVVTGDAEIQEYCIQNEIPSYCTSKDHPNGTSRCQEAWEKFRNSRRNEAVQVDSIINYQCDEVSVKPADIDRLIETTRNSWRDHPRRTDVYTLSCPTIITAWQQVPDIVKVARSKYGKALWFCREPMIGADAHIGVYGFSPIFLKEIGKLEPTPLAQSQSLEQLTWLFHDYSIHANRVSEFPLAINSEKDLAEFRRMIEC